ncbi:hypothetical protein FRX31_020547 [Thalictrum thalictroides]|uniref:Uncharacterized protein n=1 Tax=Thalictrum thalictroides TaxID=46969 RepID=A0A7J6W057_THATH|nr:hypothetical protein FRX31_020547 [Thalictrum thalictroides]
MAVQIKLLTANRTRSGLFVVEAPMAGSSKLLKPINIEHRTPPMADWQFEAADRLSHSTSRNRVVQGEWSL